MQPELLFGYSVASMPNEARSFDQWRGVGVHGKRVQYDSKAWKPVAKERRRVETQWSREEERKQSSKGRRTGGMSPSGPSWSTWVVRRKHNAPSRQADRETEPHIVARRPTLTRCLFGDISNWLGISFSTLCMIIHVSATASRFALIS